MADYLYPYTDETPEERREYAPAVNELDTLRAENARLAAEVARLRKMLYDMTSLSDWYQAGYYDSSEYVALNKEFDGKP